MQNKKLDNWKFGLVYQTKNGKVKNKNKNCAPLRYGVIFRLQFRIESCSGLEIQYLRVEQCFKKLLRFPLDNFHCFSLNSDKIYRPLLKNVIIKFSSILTKISENSYKIMHFHFHAHFQCFKSIFIQNRLVLIIRTYVSPK